MKKSTLIFGLLAVLFSFAGCSYYQNSEPCRFNKQTIDLTVKSSQWEFDDNAKQYFAHFDIPEITADVYNYGEISVSCEFNSGTKDAYQVVLPMTNYLEKALDDGSTAFFTEHFDYRVGIGYIEIQHTTNDHIYGTPPDMLFRLQMTY
jgi:hypothetical protein